MTDDIINIDTPALLVDERIVRKNIETFQKRYDSAGLKFRPHIKTHKSIRLAKLQLDAGATGINCQKIGEAEIMTDAGCDDILIPFNIIGTAKLSRLKTLHGKIRKLTVVADSSSVIEGLAGTFQDAERPSNVMIECDTGGGRCGVQTPEDAVSLASIVAECSGLAFAGLMTYPGSSVDDLVANFM